jgi:hypothetical protein
MPKFFINIVDCNIHTRYRHINLSCLILWQKSPLSFFTAISVLPFKEAGKMQYNTLVVLSGERKPLPAEDFSMNDEAIEILKKVESGELSVEEGAQRLQELENNARAAFDETAPILDLPAQRSNTQGSAAPQVIETPQQDDIPPDLGWWKKGWLIPFWIGTAILVLGALQLGWAYSSQNFFWFYCAWLPMLLGLLVLFLSWWSQQARWVHVRVRDADGSKVSISLPLPLGLAGWALRVFGRFIPNMEEKVLADLPGIIDALAREKGSTAVEVNDEDGSRVRVYIL